MNQTLVDVQEKSLIHPHSFDQPGVMYSELIETFLDLAKLCQARGQYENAEVLLSTALELKEELVDDSDYDLLPLMDTLAQIYIQTRHFASATNLYIRMFGIATRKLGSNHPYVAEILENYSLALMEAKREIEAAIIQTRAKAIRLHAPKPIPKPEEKELFEPFFSQLPSIAVS